MGSDFALSSGHELLSVYISFLQPSNQRALSSISVWHLKPLIVNFNMGFRVPEYRFFDEFNGLILKFTVIDGVFSEYSDPLVLGK